MGEKAYHNNSVGNAAPANVRFTAGSSLAENLDLETEELEAAQETVRFATSADRIYMNYPFIGHLLKKIDDHYRLKEIYRPSDPGTIEKVEEMYGSGKYRLTIIDRNGDEHPLPFEIAEPKAENTPESITSGERARLKELSEQAERQSMRIQRLEQRIEERDEELDDKARKIRNLTEQLTEVELRGEKKYQEKIERMERSLEELKDQKRNLEWDIQKKDMEMQYAGIDEEPSWMTFIEKVVQHPVASQVIEGILSKQGAPGGSQASPAANIHRLPSSLNDAQRQNPAESAPETPSAQNEDEETGEETELTEDQQIQIYQTMMQNFVNLVTTEAEKALVAKNPNFANVAKFVQAQVADVESTGVQIPTQQWISLAKDLIEFSLKNDIPNERLANVVAPLLENMGAAKSILKNAPVDGAVISLKSMFGLEMSKEEEAVLKDVLKIFKKKIKN